MMGSDTHLHHCSGVLVAQDLVVAPASCIREWHMDNYWPVVRVGSHMINFEDTEGAKVNGFKPCYNLH